GQLRGVTGGDRTIFSEDRLEAVQAFDGGVRTVAIVTVDHAFVDGALAGGFVFGEVLDRHRYDFVVEQAFGLSPRGALLALQGVGVLLLTGHVVATGHRFSGLAHAVVDPRETVLDDRVQQVVDVAALHGEGDGFN